MKNLLLSLFLLALNPAWAEGKKYTTITRTAVGQIRVERSGTKIPEPPLVAQPPECNVPPGNLWKLANGCWCDDPNCVVVSTPSPVDGGGGGSEVDPVELEQLRLIIAAIPAAQYQGGDRLGIYYNPHRKIGSENPVRIYNLKTGGYFSAYFDDQGFLRTAVGTVPNSVNKLNPVPYNHRVDINKLDFHDSAVLQTIYDEPDHSNIKITATDEVNIDMLPRFRKRYGTITRTTLINGIYMPEGSIVVGSRYDGVARPGLNDLTDLRVYSPEGVLINIIPEKDFKSLDCGTVSRAQCFDFESHYTDQQTYDHGARVFAEYNTGSFFPGESAQRANRIWLDIQKDMEANTVLNINSGNEPWHERIFKNLNKQEQTYVVNLLTQEARIKTMQEKMGYRLTPRFTKFLAETSGQGTFGEYCENNDFRTTDNDSRDEALNKTYDNMFCRLNDFSEAKLEKFRSDNDYDDARTHLEKEDAQKAINKAIQVQTITKAEYDKARQAYNQELKYGAEKRKSQAEAATSAEELSESEDPPVVDSGIPAKCQKQKNRDTKVCRQYYDAPPRCINKKGYLKKNDQTCHGYKSPGFEPAAPPPPSPQPTVKKAPKPIPKPAPPPPKAPKKKGGKKRGGKKKRK